MLTQHTVVLITDGGLSLRMGADSFFTSDSLSLTLVIPSL